MTGLVYSQDLILNGDLANAGTINAKRHIINNKNNGDDLVTVSGNGIVKLTGAAGAVTHEIKSNGTAGLSFSKLDLLGGRTANLKKPTTVSTAFRIGDGTTGYTSTFSIEANTLSIGAASSYDNDNNTGAVLTFSGGTVEFTGTAAQSILNRTAGVTYGTLNINGAGTKGFTAGGTVQAAAVTHANGALTVDNAFTVTDNSSFGSVSSSAAWTFSGTSGKKMVVDALTANSSTISASSSGEIEFTTAAASNGTISTTTGRLDFNGNLSVPVFSRYPVMAMLSLEGTVAQTTTNLNNGTATYKSSTAGQSIVTTPYNHLSLTSGSKTLAGSTTVNGNLSLDAISPLTASNNNIDLTGTLTLGSNITMGTGTLTMTSAAGGTDVSGSGEVSGALKRSATFAAATDTDLTARMCI